MTASELKQIQFDLERVAARFIGEKLSHSQEQAKIKIEEALFRINEAIAIEEVL